MTKRVVAEALQAPPHRPHGRLARPGGADHPAARHDRGRGRPRPRDPRGVAGGRRRLKAAGPGGPPIEADAAATEPAGPRSRRVRGVAVRSRRQAVGGIARVVRALQRREHPLVEHAVRDEHGARVEPPRAVEVGEAAARLLDDHDRRGEVPRPARRPRPSPPRSPRRRACSPRSRRSRGSARRAGAVGEQPRRLPGRLDLGGRAVQQLRAIERRRPSRRAPCAHRRLPAP